MRNLVALIIIILAIAFMGLLAHLRPHQPLVAPIRGTPTLALPEPDTKVTFVVVGDIMLSRHVAARIDQHDNPSLPFAQVADLLTSTDFNFGNLESPISGNDKVKGRGLVFNTSTAHVPGLVSSNFKVLNLANNHALDQGVKGLRNTTRVLSASGISYLGVGEDKAAAWHPKLMTVNGVTIGFLGASYASINDGGGQRNDYIARIEELAYLQDALTQLRSVADFIVVTMHAGIEYKRHPHPSQRAFARAAVDYGADLVIGVHPHWIQTIEQYQGKYIFYSLGNFVFDQGNHQDTREGLTLRIVVGSSKPAHRDATGAPNGRTVSAGLEKIELIPVIIQQCSPHRAGAQDSARILRKIGVTSSVITPET